MNIVYLIGNGFDLSLGLPTAWSHFYDYYFEQPNPSPTIKSFKEAIGKNPKNWSDLEKALGRYTSNLHTREELIKLHEDLTFHLRAYLKGVEANYKCDDSLKDIISNSIITPEQFLPFVDHQKIYGFKSKWSNRDWPVHIISYNYTSVFAKLVGYTGQSKSLGKSTNQNAVVSLERIMHIHGSTSRSMALGLNDISQFQNEQFHKDRQLINKYVKEQLNIAARTGHDAVCQKWIKEANLICVFGLSFGITDLRWWQYIGDRLTDENVRMIAFYYDENLKIDDLILDPANLIEEEEKVKSLFLEQTSWAKTDNEQVRNKIFVSINSKMFKIDNDKFKYNKNWWMT